MTRSTNSVLSDDVLSDDVTEREAIIDADSHVTEPADVWVTRVARRYVPHVPHVVRSDDGRDVWMLDGVQIGAVGRTAPAGWPTYPADSPATYDDCHPAAFDADARLRYLDDEGIWAQVLYPNIAGFGGQKFLTMKDAELRLACVRAYNDFLVEWSGRDPRRLIPIASTPFWDVDATVGEISRCVASGFRGVLFTGEPQRFGLPYLGDRHWDPFWSIVQETGVPVHFHIGGGEDEGILGRTTARGLAHGSANTSAYNAVDLFIKNGVQCCDLITSGVLARFPGVKVVSVESGIGWIPFVLEAADYSFLGATQAGRVRTADLLPSELFRRQVYCTYWFEQIAPTHLLDELPIDNILFETDFPHPACLYGNIRETIAKGLSGTSAEVRRKFLWDNAAALYGIEGPSVSGASLTSTAL